MSNQLTRRVFLKMAGVAAGLSIMAACAPKVIKETVVVEKPVEKVVEKEKEVTRIVEKEVTKAPPTRAPEAKVTLRYACKCNEMPESQGGGHKGLAAAFNQKYPNITIEWLFWGTGVEFFEKLLGMYAAGDPPELFNTSDVNFNKDRELSLAQHQRLDEYFERDAAEYKWDDIYPTITKYMKMFDGHYYFVPQWVNSNVLAYNVKLFDEAKVPYPTPEWTWDDMVQAGKELTKFDKDGNLVQVGKKTEGGWWGEYYYYQRQAGLQDWLSDDGQQVFLDQPEAVEGLQFYYDCVFKYKISDAPPRALPNGFAGGFYAMHNFIHTGMWPGYTAAGLTWDIMVPPKGKRREGGELALDSSAMSRGVKLAEEAWTYLKWVSGEDGGKQWVKIGFPPIRKSVAEATWLAKKDAPPMPLHPERYFDALPYNMIVFAPPGSWDIWQVLQKYVEMFWEQKITPEEACKRAAEEFRKVIASGAQKK